MATIYQSLFGSTWRVEERIGNTLYYTNHDTQEEAEEYCRQNGIEYTVAKP